MLLAIAAFVVGCTDADAEGPPVSPVSSPSPTPSTSPVPSAEARDRLFALGELWSTTAAAVTYDTIAPVPGQPVTAHLCLRQLADRASAQDYGTKWREDLFG